MLLKSFVVICNIACPLWSGLVVQPQLSTCICTRTHALSLITIFQIHFTHYPVVIGSYSLFIAYLWVEGHQNHPAKRMNINPGTQRCGRARTRGPRVCVCACLGCVCSHVYFEFASVHVCLKKKVFMPRAVSFLTMNLNPFRRIKRTFAYCGT